MVTYLIIGEKTACKMAFSAEAGYSEDFCYYCLTMKHLSLNFINQLQKDLTRYT